MSIKINFNSLNIPETPTIVLSKKNGDKLGLLNSKSVELVSAMNDCSEVSFIIYKYIDNQTCHLWNDITDHKLIHCVEWDMWFEITVSLNESTETKKTIMCKSLGHAELSQIKIYTTEINTENDIARDDYSPTVLFDDDNVKASLLHRIMEKAPHYRIIHVDDTIKNIQRVFTFDNISIYDAFQEIAKEINCIFILHSNSDELGKIQRTISVYDLYSNCHCGYRGDFTQKCPKCGSTDINEGYGEDTLIYISADELANEIKLSVDTDSVKNCFKLEAGDDLMTATIRNCNPNGTDYIWHITDKTKRDMSSELVEKLNQYNTEYSYYNNEHEINFDNQEDNRLTPIIEDYNSLVSGEKYGKYNDELQPIVVPIIGYSSLMNAYYNTVDLELFLRHSLMPSVEMSDTKAQIEVGKLSVLSDSPVAIPELDGASDSTVKNAVLAMAKILVDARYQVKITSSNYDSVNEIWTGSFSVTNYSDEEDTCESESINIVINDDYETFVKQKLDKVLNKGDTDDYSVSSLMKKDLEELKESLKQYSLNCLQAFHDSCQGCIDILIEQCISDKGTWEDKDQDLYTTIYIPYYNKLQAIESEIQLRESEIAIITGIYDADGNVVTYGLQNYILQEKNTIQSVLNFENYLGNDLWLEFCAFRREDKYSNSNYISDGLNNNELFERAREFIDVAEKEIYKSSELQHKIETSLKNLLLIPKFRKLVDSFKVGNWIRINVDNEIYKLRLIKFTIDYDKLENISVEFSDITKESSAIKSIQGVLKQAKTMTSSYDSVIRQVQHTSKETAVISDWVNNGFDATNVMIKGGSGNQTQSWDNHGMLFRDYDTLTDTYSNEQIKIINSTIAMTDNNWKSTKTAFGKFLYFDPTSQTLKTEFGINGEMLVGKLLIGESLGLYNADNSLTFNESGLTVDNGTNKVIINPNNNKSIFTIKKDDNSILSFDEDGNLEIKGKITATSFILDNTKINASDQVDGLSQVALSGEYSDLLNKPNLKTVATSGSYNDLSDKPNLKTVATSGSYNDLSDKPDLSGITTNTETLEEHTKSLEQIITRLENLEVKVFGSIQEPEETE